MSSLFYSLARLCSLSTTPPAPKEQSQDIFEIGDIVLYTKPLPSRRLPPTKPQPRMQPRDPKGECPDMTGIRTIADLGPSVPIQVTVIDRYRVPTAIAAFPQSTTSQSEGPSPVITPVEIEILYDIRFSEGAEENGVREKDLSRMSQSHHE